MPYQKSVDRPSDSTSMRSSLPWKRLPNDSIVTVRREQAGAVGDAAELAVEAGVGAAGDQPGDELGAGVGDLRAAAQPSHSGLSIGRSASTPASG